MDNIIKCKHCNKSHSLTAWEKATEEYFEEEVDIKSEMECEVFPKFEYVCPNCSTEVRGADMIFMEEDEAND